MIEALREQSTLADIARKYEIKQAQLSRWKKEFISNAAAFGGSDQQQEIKKREAERDSCHRKIGELQIDLDFAKRVSNIFDILSTTYHPSTLYKILSNYPYNGKN